MKKSERVLTLLREDWITLERLLAETEWQPHTMRAFISGARKRGELVERRRLNNITSYRIAPPGDYDPKKDLTASLDEAYTEIKQRVAAGGPGWEPSV